MRFSLKKNGKHVQFISTESPAIRRQAGLVDLLLVKELEKAVLLVSKAFPDYTFDAITSVDEAALNTAAEAKGAESGAEQKVYAESDEGKFELAFVESEREREVKEREARKDAFRKTYKPR